MPNLRDFVVKLAQSVGEGDTVTTDCPVCNGKGKFTATVSDTIVLYNCYRSSCPTKGKITIHNSPEERINYLKTKKEQRDSSGCTLPWIVPNYWLDGIGDDACFKYMREKNMWGAYKAGLFRPMYDPAERRFVFPIKNSYGDVIGAVGRTLHGANPKVLNYNRKFLQPFICGGGRENAVLVEDCASAVAATRHEAVAGVALLGTYIRDDFIPHLTPFKRVFIALDQDAYAKSFKIKKHLEAYIKNVQVIKLTQDIKDMGDQDFAELMKKYV